MEQVLITYKGYALYECGRSYKSLVGGQWVIFDSAAQWVQYINKFC